MNYKQERTLSDNVNNEILMLASSLVEDLLKNELLHYDDIENFYIDNEEELDELDEELDEVNSLLDNLMEKQVEEDGKEFVKLEEEAEKIKNKMQELEEEEGCQDIFEWYFISRWLYEKLQERNQPVMLTDYGYIWGRTCTGQSIILDSVIQEIFDK